ncbi:hypothetical protein ACK8P5_23470 [Paenibacillus sp. EC2-1]|uniref:hypothetical protein n=1 Tax=Paenibacillus sp. EC2-1 TaxID=3388665 RepID=UPI003BEEF1CE
MVAHLLWILAIYGVAVVLVHVLYARRRGRESSQQRPRMHYVLITSNHERQVEWYLRALSLYALLSGTRVRVTVLDDRSVDDTLRIVHRLVNLSGIELTVGEWNSVVGIGSSLSGGSSSGVSTSIGGSTSASANLGANESTSAGVQQISPPTLEDDEQRIVLDLRNVSEVVRIPYVQS